MNPFDQALEQVMRELNAKERLLAKTQKMSQARFAREYAKAECEEGSDTLSNEVSMEDKNE
jgi:hypothetical protein